MIRRDPSDYSTTGTVSPPSLRLACAFCLWLDWSAASASPRLRGEFTVSASVESHRLFNPAPHYMVTHWIVTGQRYSCPALTCDFSFSIAASVARHSSGFRLVANGRFGSRKYSRIASRSLGSMAAAGFSASLTASVA